jgi:hypothetical protein
MTKSSRQDNQPVTHESLMQDMQDRFAYMLYNDQYNGKHSTEFGVLEELLCDVIDDGSSEQERLEQEASNTALINYARALSTRQSNPDAELEEEIITLAGRDVVVYPFGSRIGVYYDYHIRYVMIVRLVLRIACDCELAVAFSPQLLHFSGFSSTINPKGGCCHDTIYQSLHRLRIQKIVRRRGQ